MIWQTVKTSPVTVIIGAVVGAVLVLSYPTILNVGLQQYDAATPVWSGVKASEIVRDGEALLVSLAGTKDRSCRYLRINAVTLQRDGSTVHANISRVDAPMTGMTRETG